MKTYEIILELFDLSDSDGEDIEEVLTEIFENHLPSDLKAHVVETTEVDE